MHIRTTLRPRIEATSYDTNALGLLRRDSRVRASPPGPAGTRWLDAAPILCANSFGHRPHVGKALGQSVLELIGAVVRDQLWT